MSSNATIDGSTYSIPDPRDKNYASGATGLTAYLKKIATAFSIRPSERTYELGVVTPNGGTPNLSCTDYSGQYGFLTISETSNGFVSMAINIQLSISVPASSISLSISGLTYITDQPISVAGYDGVSFIGGNYAICSSSSNSMSIEFPSPVSIVYLAGSAVLSGKPTWAS